MIQVIDFFKRLYRFFKNTRKVFWFISLCVFLIIYGEREANKRTQYEFEQLINAKKGNLLVNFRSSTKTGSSSEINGKIVEIKDTTKVYVITSMGSSDYVKFNGYPEIGTLYPVWYTDNLKVVYARGFETPEETVKFFKDLYASKEFKYNPFILILTFGLLCFILSDIYNFYRTKKMKKKF